MIGILGGGLAGLTVAAHCKQECEVLEASDRVGGHCRSTAEQGYTFDEGPHIIFSKNKKTLDYMLSLLGDNVVQGRRNNKIYYKGQYIKYPFENGIGELEPEDKYDCLRGYMDRTPLHLKQMVRRPNTMSFQDWLYSNFGIGITEKYLFPYNEKIWKCPTNEMAYDWADERLPKPKPEDVMASACGIPTEGYTHQLNFYYPKVGGIESLVKVMASKVKNITLNWPVLTVQELDGIWKVNRFHEATYYDKIVSTLPLVEMVDIFAGVPQEIKDAAKQLRFNSLITVTLGQDVYDTDLTALYVSDPKLIFHRLSFPVNFGSLKPGLIQAEITTNVNDSVWNMADGELIHHVILDIQNMSRGFGPAIPMGRVDYVKVQRLKYGYPVPTFTYRENLKKVRTYFEEQGVILCGRNAEFEYINMDQCIERGIEVAGRLLSTAKEEAMK